MVELIEFHDHWIVRITAQASVSEQRFDLEADARAWAGGQCRHLGVSLMESNEFFEAYGRWLDSTASKPPV